MKMLLKNLQMEVFWMIHKVLQFNIVSFNKSDNQNFSLNNK
jgi:hypothetical protein